MGRPRLNRALPRYASEFIDRHGKPRIRLRKTGLQTRYVLSEVGTPEFTEEYTAWLNSTRPPITVAAVVPHSFDDLIQRYYSSMNWKNITNARTQRVYKGDIERFRNTYGSRQVDGFTAARLSKMMGGMADRPTAANNLRKRLSQLFDYAIMLGWQKDNPAKAVRPYKIKGDGIKAWGEEQIAQFEAKHPIGTKPYLAFALLLYTAQRRSDMVVMGMQHIENGLIRVRQLKTDTKLSIPMHPNLTAAIAACPSGHLSFLVNSYGAPFQRDYFGNWFRKQCDAAGLKGYSAHGLRKAASRRMAELGMSNQMIKSITGHTSDSEVSRYTKSAEQEKLARMAMDGLANASNLVSQMKAKAIANKGN